MSGRGELLTLRLAAARLGMHHETLRRLLSEGKGPPATKRPGSNRWFFWSNEIDAWFDGGRSDRPPPKRHDVADEAGEPGGPIAHGERLPG